MEAIALPRAVVDFARRNGCVPCMRLEPHLKAAAKSPALEDISFFKVMLDEVDDDLLNYAMDQVGIQSTPTVMEYRYGSVYAVVKERTGPKLIKELANG